MLMVAAVILRCLVIFSWCIFQETHWLSYNLQNYGIKRPAKQVKEPTSPYSIFLSICFLALIKANSQPNHVSWLVQSCELACCSGKMVPQHPLCTGQPTGSLVDRNFCLLPQVRELPQAMGLLSPMALWR